MQNVYFDTKLIGQQLGKTKGSDGEVIYYEIHQTNGLGEQIAFQVNCESNKDKNTFVFEGTNHIKRNGIHYFLK